MKILITGGAGFIGSHLVDACLKAGHKITIIDDFSTGIRRNLGQHRKNPDCSIIEETVMNAGLVDYFVRETDYVFHLASAVGVKYVFNNPVETIETTFVGSRHVLHACRVYNKPVLLTSTSEVYGRGVKVPFTEHDDVVLGSTASRRWFYACSKMLEECLALGHWHEAKLPVTCVRLFNTVGPRQVSQYGMVFPAFVKQALVNEPITVYGDGSQSRCFCHVEDVIGALLQLMENPNATAGEIINIGNDKEISIGQLAERVKRVLQSESSITFIPYDKAYGEGFEDMQRRIPDISLARKLLNFEPQRSLDDMIISMAEYLRELAD